MTLQAIREAKAAKVAQMRAMLAKADTEKRSLSADESSAFDALKAEVADLETQEQRAEFLAEQERRMSGTAVNTPSGDDRFEVECRAFSLTRAIAAQMGANVDAGREREVSQEIERRSGQKFNGFAVPMQVFEERVITTAAPAAGPGSNIIATDHRGDLYIDRLRAALRIRQLGATVLSGLVGNVDIPGLKASATAGWVAENAAITASDMQFRKVQLSPKHCGAMTEFSRNMLQQSSPDVEQLVRNDFAAVLAEAVDKAAINGAGTTEPVGILQASGTQSQSLATLSWANILAMLEKIETSNGSATAFLTHPKVITALRKTLKESGLPGYLMDDNRSMAGFPVAGSNLVPVVDSTTDTSSLILGNWSDVLIGYWSAFDLLVNPYSETAYSKGNVLVRGMLTCDVAVRHPENFVIAEDVAVA